MKRLLAMVCPLLFSFSILAEPLDASLNNQIPLIRTSDRVLEDGISLKAPWFDISLDLINNSQIPVTITGVRFNIASVEKKYKAAFYTFKTPIVIQPSETIRTQAYAGNLFESSSMKYWATADVIGAWASSPHRKVLATVNFHTQ